MQLKPESIDHYLSTLSEPRRSTLQKLRRLIHRKMPGAVECISYSMPAFRLNGDVICGFLATTKGCSYYPFSGSALSGLTDELAAYGGTSSAVHFAADTCLPEKLVELLLKARIAESDARRAAKQRLGAKPSAKSSAATQAAPAITPQRRAAKKPRKAGKQPSTKAAKRTAKSAQRAARTAKPASRSAKQTLTAGKTAKKRAAKPS